VQPLAGIMEEILNILNSFDPISLEEMKGVKLLNRVDTKYSFNIKYLPGILQALAPEYRILAFDDTRVNHYETLYFDTSNMILYNQHQCGKLNRYKFRYRCYKDTQITFFEVKLKNNKKRTIKERMRQPCIEQEIKGAVSDFVRKNASIDPDSLLPRLWVRYKRITLVNKNSQERLTIDLNLSYQDGEMNRSASFPHLVIAELKQDKSADSFFATYMRNVRIHRVSISKYCFGIYNVYDHVRYNNFKEKFRKINKIAS